MSLVDPAKLDAANETFLAVTGPWPFTFTNEDPHEELRRARRIIELQRKLLEPTHCSHYDRNCACRQQQRVDLECEEVRYV